MEGEGYTGKSYKSNVDLNTLADVKTFIKPFQGSHEDLIRTFVLDSIVNQWLIKLIQGSDLILIGNQNSNEQANVDWVENVRWSTTAPEAAACPAERKAHEHGLKEGNREDRDAKGLDWEVATL